MEDNPWLEVNLAKFLVYLCPECKTTIANKGDFLMHAISNHDKARIVYKAVVVADDSKTQLKISTNMFNVQSKAKPKPGKPVSAIQESLDIKTEVNSDHDDANEDDFENAVDDLDTVQDDLDNDPNFSDQEDVKPLVKKAKKRKASPKPLPKSPAIKKKPQKENVPKPNKPKLTSFDSEDLQEQCYHCSEMIDLVKMQDHTQKVHGDNVPLKHGPKLPFQCPICKGSKESQDKSLHECHSVKAVLGCRIQCELCPDFPKFNRKHWETHMLMLHKEDHPYECLKCDLRFKDAPVLQRHHKRIHMKQLDFTCEQCGKAFFEVYKLKEHKDSVHSEYSREAAEKTKDKENYICKHCNAPFPNYYHYRKHLKKFHQIGATSNGQDCEECGLRYLSKKFHRILNHPTSADLASVKANCEKCDQEFNSATILNKHLKSCLPRDKLNHLSCKSCPSKDWHSSTALQKHLAEAHGMIRLVCPEEGCILKMCGSTAIKNHINLKHREETRNKECKYCGDKFKRDDVLRLHIMSQHEKDKKPFKCQYCDYSSVMKRKLLDHVNAKHTQKEVYSCSLCNFTSYRPSGIVQHTKVVHEKWRPFKCDHCGQGFLYKKELAKHCLSQHGFELA